MKSTASNDILASLMSRSCLPSPVPTTMSSNPFAELRVLTRNTTAKVPFTTSSLSSVSSTGGAVKRSEGQRFGRSCLASQSTGSCWYSKEFPCFKKWIKSSRPAGSEASNICQLDDTSKCPSNVCGATSFTKPTAYLGVYHVLQIPLHFDPHTVNP